MIFLGGPDLDPACVDNLNLLYQKGCEEWPVAGRRCQGN